MKDWNGNGNHHIMKSTTWHIEKLIIPQTDYLLEVGIPLILSNGEFRYMCDCFK